MTETDDGARLWLACSILYSIYRLRFCQSLLYADVQHAKIFYWAMEQARDFLRLYLNWALSGRDSLNAAMFLNASARLAEKYNSQPAKTINHSDGAITWPVCMVVPAREKPIASCFRSATFSSRVIFAGCPDCHYVLALLLI